MHTFAYSPMTDTAEIYSFERGAPLSEIDTRQLWLLDDLKPALARRHRAARRARKAGRVAFGTLAALGAAVTATVVAFGPSSLLDAADLLASR